jgi:hypothetical protein
MKRREPLFIDADRGSDRNIPADGWTRSEIRWPHFFSLDGGKPTEKKRSPAREPLTISVSPMQSFATDDTDDPRATSHSFCHRSIKRRVRGA